VIEFLVLIEILVFGFKHRHGGIIPMKYYSNVYSANIVRISNEKAKNS